jgi:glutamate dehydrogenase
LFESLDLRAIEEVPHRLTPEGAPMVVLHVFALRAGAACAEVEWPSGPALTFLAATPVGEAVAPDAMVSAANAGRTERQWPA